MERRDALWQAAAVAREGKGAFAGVAPADGPSPLRPMDAPKVPGASHDFY